MIVDVEFLEHIHKIERKLAQLSALLVLIPIPRGIKATCIVSGAEDDLQAHILSASN